MHNSFPPLVFIVKHCFYAPVFQLRTCRQVFLGFFLPQPKAGFFQPDAQGRYYQTRCERRRCETVFVDLCKAETDLVLCAASARWQLSFIALFRDVMDSAKPQLTGDVLFAPNDYNQYFCKF